MDVAMLPEALSLTVSVAVFAPGDAGVIMTVIVQLPVSAASTFPVQPSAVNAKSVAGAMLVVSAAVCTPPGLVTVNTCVAPGLPCTADPKLWLSGESATELGMTPGPVGAGGRGAVPPVTALTDTAPVRA